ncbi:unnamed protein product [Prorocentrum cordatum]|uniref:AAA+ ATPase domain-containing protein n=1 Tax=Prorocentrum cordatum TaxID=2364126 RepID=A0ABN9TSL3_9DINO|nr:unnamed protein product [Polarella glacialis]
MALDASEAKTLFSRGVARVFFFCAGLAGSGDWVPVLSLPDEEARLGALRVVGARDRGLLCAQTEPGKLGALRELPWTLPLGAMPAAGGAVQDALLAGLLSRHARVVAGFAAAVPAARDMREADATDPGAAEAEFKMKSLRLFGQLVTADEVERALDVARGAAAGGADAPKLLGMMQQFAERAGSHKLADLVAGLPRGAAPPPRPPPAVVGGFFAEGAGAGGGRRRPAPPATPLGRGALGAPAAELAEPPRKVGRAAAAWPAARPPAGEPTAGRAGARADDAAAGAGCDEQVGSVGVAAAVPADRTRVPLLPASRGAAFPSGAAGALHALRWMMQKSELRQDMFLLGEAGPELRHLVYLYCALLGKELEYVAISRDTSEPDLKQRREIIGGRLQYVDQPPVRAAKLGRVLLLEGVEKAERNVLPTLNNLLENREMALEDGTFLSAPRRARELGNVEGHVAVSERFEVIAIGQPSRGNPLDPPLRSRFAALRVPPRGLCGTPGEELLRLAQCMAGVPEPPLGAARQIVALAELLASGRAVARRPADPAEAAWPVPLPASSLGAVVSLAAVLPAAPLRGLLLRACPAHLLHSAGQRLGAIEKALEACGLAPGAPREPGQPAVAYDEVWRIARHDSDPRACIVEFCSRSGAMKSVPAAAPCGPRGPAVCVPSDRPPRLPVAGIQLTTTQRGSLAAMLQDHAAGVDVCILGERGVGKSALVRAFCELLGYQPHTLFCYQDMLSRDLLQRRTTDAHGNTAWQNSPLLLAAIRGEVAVLDGLHRLAPGLLYSSLGRLLRDREAELADGSRLASPERFDRLLAEGFSSQDLADRRIQRVHPAFRVIGIAELPEPSGVGAWLTEEACTLFHFHEVRPLPGAELRELCLAGAGRARDDDDTGPRCMRLFDGLVGFSRAVRARLEVAPERERRDLDGMALSLRQLLRAGRHLLHTGGDAAGAVERALSARLRFLRPAAREEVGGLLAQAMAAAGAELPQQLLQPSAGPTGRAPTAEITEGQLHIGDVVCSISAPRRPELVPEVEFTDTRQHMLLLQDMLLDWALGHHLLLVGNQGTGKNKLADRLLQLLGQEREYVQLHRDTTVQSLLMAQSVDAGVVSLEDSALVRAVRHGRCLLVDEADKAPLEVVSVLKAIADDGELALGDGRCIVRGGDPRLHAPSTFAEGASASAELLLETAPGFRMIVLANRPGFPFLGNDFFRVCGDVFSCHAVDNPDGASELELMAACGPGVPRGSLERLASLFAELRGLADEGALRYPYSTRELAKAVRHLGRFPDDSLERALGDAFAFDLEDGQARGAALAALRRHGLATTPEGLERLAGTAGARGLRLESCSRGAEERGLAGLLSAPPRPGGAAGPAGSGPLGGPRRRDVRGRGRRLVHHAAWPWRGWALHPRPARGPGLRRRPRRAQRPRWPAQSVRPFRRRSVLSRDRGVVLRAHRQNRLHRVDVRRAGQGLVRAHRGLFVRGRGRRQLHEGGGRAAAAAALPPGVPLPAPRPPRARRLPRRALAALPRPVGHRRPRALARAAARRGGRRGRHHHPLRWTLLGRGGQLQRHQVLQRRWPGLLSRQDEFWATCRARCAPGVDTLEDHDPEFQTPWSCAVLGGDRSSGPAAGGSPWPAEDAANDAIGAADETVSHQEAAGSSADESAGAEDDVHGEVGDALEIADGMHLVVGDSDGAAGDPIVRGFDDAADEAKASDEHSDRTGVRPSGSVGSAGSVKKGVSTSVLGTPGQHGQSGHGPPGQNWPPQPTAQKHRSRNSTEENSSGSVVVPSKHPVRRMQDSLAEGLQNAHAGALHHTGRAADAAQDLHESAREHAQKAGGAVVDTVQGLHSGAMEHAGKVTGTLVGTALDVHGGLKSSVERAAEQLAGAASRDNAAALKRLGHVADAAEDVHDAAKSHADRTANALVGAMQAVAGSLSALAGALAPSFGIQTDETRQRAQEAKDAAYGGRDGDTHGGRWKVAGGRWAYVKAGAAED